MATSSEKVGFFSGKLLLVLLPLLVAVVYILPPLYVHVAYRAPKDRMFSQFAFDQLYNYDEYGAYLPAAESILHGKPPYIDISSYEGRNIRILSPNFLPFYVIALFDAAFGQENSMPAIDIVFAFISFYIIYYFVLKIVQSRKAALFAALLTMLPMPLLHIFDYAGASSPINLPMICLFTNELPFMSRTFTPQMTFPLLLIFSMLASRIEKGKASATVVVLAGVLLAVSVYTYLFGGIIAGLFLFKCAMGAIASKNKAAARSLFIVAALALFLSVPYIINAYALVKIPAARDFEQRIGALNISRFSLANIAAVLFLAALYVIYFLDVLKKPAFILAIVMIPVALIILLSGWHSPSFDNIFTPVFYLLLAASLDRKKPYSIMFLIMVSCVEPPLLMRMLTGKTHAEVYYFQRNYFQQFIPIMIVTYGWVAFQRLKEQAGRMPRHTAVEKMKIAVFASALVAVVSLGVANSIIFAAKNHDNYFIRKDMSDAVNWMQKNIPVQSVVVSFDTSANLWIGLKTRNYLYLPRGFFSAATLDELTRRVASASAITGVDPMKLNWKKWNGFGFYTFEALAFNKYFRRNLKKRLAEEGRRDIGRYRMDYVWFGPYEKAVSTLSPDRDPALARVYRGGSVDIYRVVEQRR